MSDDSAAAGRVEPTDAFPAPGAVGSRGALLRILAGTGVAAVAGAWLGEDPPPARAAPSRTQDRRIFNFALLLEYVKDSFYGEALAHGWPRGELRQFAEVAGAHERAHAAFLVQQLGKHARPRPKFEFGASTRSPATFVATARALEELAVAAYNGQAANLTKGGLAAAVRIVSVEGRHAAWIRAVAGVAPAPRAADPGEAPAAVTAALRRLNIR